MISQFAQFECRPPGRRVGVVGGLGLVAVLTVLVGCSNLSLQLLPLRAKSNDLEAKMAYARLCERHGQTDQALQLYQGMIKQDQRQQFAYERLGVLSAKRGQYKEADDYFQQAAQLAPPTAELYNDIGYNYFLQDRLQEAEQAFRNALERNPHFAAAHNNLGLVLGQEGRYEDALASFRKGGNEAQAYCNLAYVYAQNQDLTHAQQYFSRALDHDENLRPAAEGLLQVAGMSDGRPPAAYKQFAKSVGGVKNKKPLAAHMSKKPPEVSRNKQANPDESDENAEEAQQVVAKLPAAPPSVLPKAVEPFSWEPGSKTAPNPESDSPAAAPAVDAARNGPSPAATKASIADEVTITEAPPRSKPSKTAAAGKKPASDSAAASNQAAAAAPKVAATPPAPGTAHPPRRGQLAIAAEERAARASHELPKPPPAEPPGDSPATEREPIAAARPDGQSLRAAVSRDPLAARTQVAPPSPEDYAATKLWLDNLAKRLMRLPPPTTAPASEPSGRSVSNSAATPPAPRQASMPARRLLAGAAASSRRLWSGNTRKNPESVEPAGTVFEPIPRPAQSPITPGRPAANAVEAPPEIRVVPETQISLTPATRSPTPLAPSLPRVFIEQPRAETGAEPADTLPRGRNVPELIAAQVALLSGTSGSGITVAEPPAAETLSNSQTVENELATTTQIGASEKPSELPSEALAAHAAPTERVLPAALRFWHKSEPPSQTGAISTTVAVRQQSLPAAAPERDMPMSIADPATATIEGLAPPVAFSTNEEPSRGSPFGSADEPVQVSDKPNDPGDVTLVSAASGDRNAHAAAKALAESSTASSPPEATPFAEGRAEAAPQRPSEVSSSADLLAQARSALEAGNYEQARDAASQALETSPTCAEALACRASAYAALNEWELALADGKSLVRAYPERADGFLVRGRALAGRGDWDGALEQFEMAVTLEPERAESWLERGRAHLRRRELREAWSDFDNAVTKAPGFAPAYVERARACRLLGQVQESIEDYAAALRLGGPAAEPLLERAMAYLEMRETNKALEDLNQAIDQAPGDARLYVARARAYRLKKATAEALEDLQTAIRLAPADARVQAEMASLQAELGAGQ